MRIKSQDKVTEQLLIHPGETLFEIMKDREITLKELALKTEFTEKHISSVISGENNISAKFALKLQSALFIPASFWSNLQANYDFAAITFKKK